MKEKRAVDGERLAPGSRRRAQPMSMSSQVPNDYLEWEFEMAGREPFTWHVQAQLLIRAAEQLYRRSVAARALEAQVYRRDPQTGLPINDGRPLRAEDVELLSDREQGRIALMLLAFAIENQCKAVLVSKQPQLISGNARLPGSLVTHDLGKLVGACGVAVTSTESAVLARLSEYTWAGRYPVPTDAIRRKAQPPVQGAWIKNRLGPVDELWRIGREILARIA